MTPDEFRENDDLRGRLKELLREPALAEAIASLRLRYGAAMTTMTPALSEHDRAHAFSYLAGYNKAFTHLAWMAEAPKPALLSQLPQPFEHAAKNVPEKPYE